MIYQYKLYRSQSFCHDQLTQDFSDTVLVGHLLLDFELPRHANQRERLLEVLIGK
jgi:hypothetical protein